MTRAKTLDAKDYLKKCAGDLAKRSVGRLFPPHVVEIIREAEPMGVSAMALARVLVRDFPGIGNSAKHVAAKIGEIWKQHRAGAR